MSAIPVAAAMLERMPRDARGVAIFEVMKADDAQAIDAPPGVEIRWLVNSDPHRPRPLQLDAIRALELPLGKVRTCIAGEHGMVTWIRDHLLNGRGLNRRDLYISGYWEIGLVEEEHQIHKNSKTGAV